MKPLMQLKVLPRAISAVLAAGLSYTPAGFAANVPDGFADDVYVSGLTQPSSMAFAPDGRLFVTEQGGKVRVIDADGNLLPDAFVSLNVDSSGERGLLGLDFDPDFSNNKFVYVYYTVPTANGVEVHNRVSRFTANGNVAASGSEKIIHELSTVFACCHNGGAIHFGTDGKLYVAVGENTTPENAQDKSREFGKLLRFNPDGSIPSDNPFSAPDAPSVWAMGFRNPFTFGVHPKTGQIFVNDVGQASWEEINQVVRGGNYGWPATEGPTTNSAFVAPLFAYPHSGNEPKGCAIAGGAFYVADANAPSLFPSNYNDRYFFSDLCSGWIYSLNSKTGGDVQPFASAAGSLVDIDVGPDGALYYLSIQDGSVGVIDHAGPDFGAPPAPTATSTPTPSPSPTATSTPTPTATPEPTATSTPTPTATPEPTATSTPTPTTKAEPTATATTAPTATSTPVPTATPEPTATSTPVPTATTAPAATSTPVPTDVPTPVPTEAPTPVPTDVPTPVPTDVPTPVATETPTVAPTAAPTPVPTEAPTPVVPTVAPVITPTPDIVPPGVTPGFEPAQPVADTDGDGVPDDQDNCTLIRNPTQFDSNRDGYGNACDGDLNNSGLVTMRDARILLNRLGSTTFRDGDLNGDGRVTFRDYNILRGRMLNQPPGPSGLVGK